MKYSAGNFVHVCFTSLKILLPQDIILSKQEVIFKVLILNISVSSRKERLIGQIKLFSSDFINSLSVGRSIIKLVLCQTALKLNTWIIFFKAIKSSLGVQKV